MNLHTTKFGKHGLVGVKAQDMKRSEQAENCRKERSCSGALGARHGIMF